MSYIRSILTGHVWLFSFYVLIQSFNSFCNREKRKQKPIRTRLPGVYPYGRSDKSIELRRDQSRRIDRSRGYRLSDIFSGSMLIPEVGSCLRVLCCKATLLALCPICGRDILTTIRQRSWTTTMTTTTTSMSRMSTKSDWVCKRCGRTLNMCSSIKQLVSSCAWYQYAIVICQAAPILLTWDRARVVATINAISNYRGGPDRLFSYLRLLLWYIMQHMDWQLQIRNQIYKHICFRGN